MSLDHAILGFVNELPRSGYDLKKAFNASVAHIWPANQSQIYRTLARLEREGLVEVRVILQEGKPNRNVYHITERGLQELRRWLAAPLPLPDVREAFLVQVFFADTITVAEIVGLLEARASMHRERLELYRGFHRKLAEDPPKGEWDKVLDPLIVDTGILQQEAWLAWLDRALDRVKALPPRRTGA